MSKCKVCGAKVNNRFNYCPNCGAQLKNIKSVSSNKVESTLASKSISPKIILISVAVLLIVGTAILYFSGVLESHKIETSNQVTTNQLMPGADLTKLEEINSLEKQVNENPENYDALLNLAHLLNDSGFKEKAIEKYQKYLKKFPKEADVLVDMGVCYYELGKNQSAIMYMEEALKYQPNHQIANLNLGIVNSTMGEIDKAKNYWKRAVELNPNNEIGKKAQELINSH